MVFSDRYISTLHRLLVVPTYSVTSLAHLDNNNMNPYKVIIEADIKTSSEIEVPTVLRQVLYRKNTDIAREILSKKNRIGTLVALESKSCNASGSIALIKALTSSHLLHKGFCKGQIYYGCKGVIFDKDMRMLLMVNERCRVGDHKFIPTGKIVVHVSPTIFLDRSGMLEKYIINKIIPAFLYKDENYENRYEVKIKVDNAEEFIRTIQPPKDRDVNETLNNLLENNINHLLLQR